MIRSRMIAVSAALAVSTCFAQTATQPQQPMRPPVLPTLPKLNLRAQPIAAPVDVAFTPHSTAAVTPYLAFNSMTKYEVRDIHLRPLFTTTIHVPEAVSSLAVGAPTLFEVEHKDSEPDLVFIKPSTHQAAVSNLLIALVSGQTISVRLISSGDAGSSDPVDFVVDYRVRKSLFETADLPGQFTSTPDTGRVPGSANGRATNEGLPAANADSALDKQLEVGSPHWSTAPELAKLIKANALAPNNIAIAVGDIRQEGESMTVSFSVLNISNHWVTIMPPQIELTDPLISKKEAKKKGNFAEPVLGSDYRLDNAKLSPGARADGSITFPKPDSKNAKESLLLHIATSGAIDTPVYYPLPFVAPSSTEMLSYKEGENASN